MCLCSALLATPSPCSPAGSCGCPMQDGDASVQPEFWYYEGSDSGWSARGSETGGRRARRWECAIFSTIEAPDHLHYNASPLRSQNGRVHVYSAPK